MARAHANTDSAHTGDRGQGMGIDTTESFDHKVRIYL